MSTKTAVCTIVSRSQLPQARALVASIRQFHPDWEPWVLLADRGETGLASFEDRISFVEIGALPIPDLPNRIFGCDLPRLVEEFRPLLLAWLTGAKKYDRAICLDADIQLYAPMTKVVSLWEKGALAILTPNLTARLPEGSCEDERGFLQAGTYNLGFVAVARHPELSGLLDYWAEKSQSDLAIELDNPTFRNQKWLDFLPGLFRDVRILRHPGYNVARWNLAQRPITRQGDRFRVDGQPLVSFHFSGLDPARPDETTATGSGSLRAADLGAARKIVDDYCRRLVTLGLDNTLGSPWAFANFSDDTPIPPEVRALYRRDESFRNQAGDDPFDASTLGLLERAWLPAEDGLPALSLMMRAVYEARSDVRAAYPDVRSAHRVAFARWFVSQDDLRNEIPGRFFESVEAWLAGQSAIVPAPGAPVPAAAAPPVAPPAPSKVASAHAPTPISPIAAAAPPEERPVRLGPWMRRLARETAFRLGLRPRPTPIEELALRQSPSIEKLTGFHPQSDPEKVQGFAWMDTRAEIVLSEIAGGDVRISGHFSPELLVCAGRKPRTILKVALGSRALGSVTLRRAGGFEASFRLPATPLEEGRLRLWASQGFVPRDAGMGDDTRTLALQICEIALDGFPVVDFSRDDSPYRFPPLARKFVADFGGAYEQNPDDRAHGMVWVGRRTTLRLEGLGDAANVRIVGEYHPAFINLAHGSPLSTLRVELSGLPVGETILEAPGFFDVSFPLPKQERRRAILTLQLSRAFVPIELGINPDIRSLAVRLARIEIDGHAWLDFSRPASPYQLGAAPPQPGVNVVGYVQNDSGVGQSSRLCARSCAAVDLPHTLFDFREALAPHVAGAESVPRPDIETAHRINILHVNADQVTVMRNVLGDRFLDRRYNIGVWHWELGRFPDEWLESFEPLDEIWAPSRFVLDSVSPKSPIPVVHMPHGIGFEVSPDLSRKAFGLPDDRFLFLMMYDMLSFQSRKNPEAVVEAFARAFPDSRRAGLVIKVMNSEANPEARARLTERLSAIPGTFLIDRTLSRQEVYDLEAACDSYVSLHRSEGWGMNLAESMFLGKPVIGTNWSGNTDFMSPANSCAVDYRLVALEKDEGPYHRGELWADPDVEHASFFMKKLVADPAWRGGIARAGQATLQKEFSFEAAGRRYKQRLAIIEKLSRAYA